MNIVYFDESGNTGTNLSDNTQPVFILAAMSVSVFNWRNLEMALEKDISTFFPDRPDNFEIHATALRNGCGYFRTKDIALRMEFCNSWLKRAEEHGCSFFYRAIEKKKFLLWTIENYGNMVKINPHMVAFALLSNVVNDNLKSEDKLGMFVMDENKEISRDVEKFIKMLRGPENTICLSQIIEKGFFIDSSQSLPLQLCDLCAYYLRKYEENRLGIPVKQSDMDISREIQKMVVKRTESFYDVMQWFEKQQKKERPGDKPKVD